VRRVGAFGALLVTIVVVCAGPALADGPGYGGDADALVVTVVSTDASSPDGDLTPAPTLGDAPLTPSAPVDPVAAAGGPGRVRAAVFVAATDPPPGGTTLRLEARGFLARSPMNISVPGGQVVAHADRFGTLDTLVQATSRHGRVRVRGINADLDKRALEATIPTGVGGSDPRPLVFGTLAAVAVAIAVTPIVRRRWAR
jgi:hypothetical protein